MKRMISLTCALLIVWMAPAQEIRTGIRVLHGIAIGNEIDSGDFGLGFSIGYDHQLSDYWQVYGALETGGNAALGTYFLGDLGARYHFYSSEQFRVSARASLLPGMMGYRDDPPFLFGSSLGIDLQRITGSWRWYISPGIRRLQPYHPLADFASLTDLEIRIGASWVLGKKDLD